MGTLFETGSWEAVTEACESSICLGKRAIKAGLSAGLSFTVYQMMASLFLRGNMFYHLKMMAAIVVGRIALDAWHPLGVAVPVGFVVQMIFSIILAFIFVFSLDFLPWPVDTPVRIMTAGSIYGFVLWAYGFCIIAPFFGWTWFRSDMNQLGQGIVGSVLFYGLMLGFFLSRREETSAMK